MYFVAAALLLAIAFLVFRVFVRRDYRRKGRLTFQSCLLELLVWGLYMVFPYLYNPPHRGSFWSSDVPVHGSMRIGGVVCIVVGLVSAFGTINDRTAFDKSDCRNVVPRFTPDNRKANQVLVDLLSDIATRKSNGIFRQIALLQVHGQKSYLKSISDHQYSRCNGMGGIDESQNHQTVYVRDECCFGLMD